MKKNVYIILILVLSTISIFFISLKLWRTQIDIPIVYWGDALWLLTPIKSFILNSSFYNIPQLSTPFGLNAIGFPCNTHVDWLISGIIGKLTQNCAITLNLLWLITIILTSLTSNYALTKLGVNKITAFGSSLVYAFLPYVYMRNISHINLVYYAVPIICMLAALIAQNKSIDKENKTSYYIGFAACLIQGLSYIYMSFFSVIILAFSGIFGGIKYKSTSPLKLSSLAILIIVIFSTINLFPSLISWHVNGKPPNMNYKTVKESEIYAAKIRQMLLPSLYNPITPFSKWVKIDAEASFPNENENITARLGLYTSIGFIFAMCISLNLYNSKRTYLNTMAAFTLFTLLIITNGGIGAIINTLMLTDFRCYNRFSVFLAFFSIGVISLLVTEIQEKFKNKWITTKLSSIVFTLVIFLSLYDQAMDARPIYSQYEYNKQLVDEDKNRVLKIENYSPIGSKIFQLPITSFPLDSGRCNMRPYDHARPFLWSHKLEFSWPPFSKRLEEWNNRITKLQPNEQIRELQNSHFNLIWIDKNGYCDSGAEIIKSYQNAGAILLSDISDGRIAILDIRNTESIKSN